MAILPSEYVMNLTTSHHLHPHPHCPSGSFTAAGLDFCRGLVSLLFLTLCSLFPVQQPQWAFNNKSDHVTPYSRPSRSFHHTQDGILTPYNGPWALCDLAPFSPSSLSPPLAPAFSLLHPPWFSCCSTHIPSCSCLRAFVLVPSAWKAFPPELFIAYFKYQWALSWPYILK